MECDERDANLPERFWQVAFGPLLGAVEYAKDLHAFGSHAVREYEGRPRNDQLTGIGYTTVAPGRRIITEDPYGVADLLCYMGCRGRIVVAI